MKSVTRARLDLFDATSGLNRGASRVKEAVWYLVKCVVFLSALPWPSKVKVALLRGFGARVGSGCVIKPRVNVHMPWKLHLGDHVWIGEEAFILNFEPVSVGSHCCISQRSFLCTGNHDFRDPAMPYRNAPITLEDGVWIGACVFVGPGVSIGCDAVIGASSVVTTSLAGGYIYAGHPCEQKGSRWRK